MIDAESLMSERIGLGFRVTKQNHAKTKQTLGKNTYLGNMFLGFMVTKENCAKTKQTLGKNTYLGNMLTTIDEK